MDALLFPHTHLEPVMGTVVGISSRDPLPAAGLAGAVEVLHQADRVFSTWDPASPMSRLRSGQAALDDLDTADADLITAVLDRCQLARRLTGGAFDPWAMPGGVDPTGLVKGWAADQALRALQAAGVLSVMVNAGGDITVAGCPGARIAVRHPAQPQDYAAIIEVDMAIATSGDYERPGQLIDPATGRTARVGASATVTGPELDLADALATGLAVKGGPMLAVIDRLIGYEAYLITDNGRHYATPGMRFAVREAPGGGRRLGQSARC
jgi:thiamine biosynthesis lipoprotein